MNHIIDLHTHLDLLHPAFKLRSKLNNHTIGLEDHLKSNTKCILNVAIYVPFGNSYKDILKKIDYITKQIERLDGCILIKNTSDLNSSYSLGIILHIESGRLITSPNDQLSELYTKGIRGIIPMHFIDNTIGSSCDDILRRLHIKKEDKGLSKFGENFIHQANKQGMWIDLSHTTNNTAKNIIEISKYIMISHVGIRELENWQRNKSIDVLKQIALKNGVIGLTPWRHLIGKHKNSYTKVFEYAISHSLGNSICIGTDFGAPISTHKSILSLFDIENALKLPEEQLTKVKWSNAFNFFERVLANNLD